MTKPTANGSTDVVDVPPDVLEQWLEDDEALLVDVREDFERAFEQIEGARHVALSKFEPQQVRDLAGGRRVVFHCRTGRRSAEAARRFGDDDEEVFHLVGGLEGWKASGRVTKRSAGAPKIDVMRQVQMTAGSLVLAGVLLGAFVSPWFLILSGFVGGGLVFAGASGWCGMAMLLGRMPWNRVSSASCST
ncbi:MAG: rhodanese-like domain-containing protein [Planctomycetota bacterium]